MILHIAPRRYLLLSHKKGKILGEHTSYAKAKAQETAIDLAKARAAGDRVPAAPRRTRRRRSRR